MPAIQIERLKSQIEAILNPAFLPEDFISSMRSFMEAHANLAYRVSPQVLRTQQMASYQLAPVIINQLNLQMSLFAKKHPEIAIQFADLLWQESHIEMKALAGEILGGLPSPYHQHALERTIAWVSQNKDKTQRKLIFESSTRTFISDNFSDWQKIIKNWLSSGDMLQILSGLQALVILLEASNFDNHPFIYSVIDQINLKNSEKINNALSDLFSALAMSNPVETSLFVKSMILKNPSAELFRIIRRSLPSFPPNQQDLIRRLLKS